jgi:uncharacterized protein YneF (UPF0154 family)
MEMDRQTIMVVCCAIIGLTLFGGVYLSSSPAKREVRDRPLYAQEDIRYKFQQEDAKKKPKPKKTEPVAEPAIVTNKTTGIASSKPKRLSSSKPSSGGDYSSEEESSDESSSSEDDEPHEEPPLE